MPPSYDADRDSGLKPTATNYYPLRTFGCASGASVGQISFKDGVLTLITKRWTDTKNVTDLMSAFYGAVSELEKRGFNQCRVAAQERLLPNQDFRYVELVCTEHMHLRITLMRTPETPLLVTVEQIVAAKWPKSGERRLREECD